MGWGGGHSGEAVLMGAGSPCVHEVSRATERGTRFPCKSLPASGTIHGLEFEVEFDLSLQCGKHRSAC